MVEVFKTNVYDAEEAQLLCKALRQTFPAYEVNFDLDDCDRILRIKNRTGRIDVFPVVRVLSNHGYEAEVLPDLPPVWPRDFRCFWQWRPTIIHKAG
jgi:hypothetical protein